jgi:MoaA/NifB/PqqE/SkfB family radical SAM enzyme
LINPMDHPVLTGLHILLTYQCTFECDHCFVWGSPWQVGTLSLPQIRNVLGQAREMQSVREIYFEGGEPFMYYATLVKAVEEADQMGFEVGIVSNAYWALTQEDACEWLKPFKGRLVDLSVSSDLFHYNETYSYQIRNAEAAAESFHIPCGVIKVASSETDVGFDSYGVIQHVIENDFASVMYRGRAVVKLAEAAKKYQWDSFTNCPHENLRSPGRIHLDPLGNLHVCQGISIGNLFEQPLEEIWKNYSPMEHPIIGPLVEGGPAELARRYSVSHPTECADSCHLCYITRLSLRKQFPYTLIPDQMYGIF